MGMWNCFYRSYCPILSTSTRQASMCRVIINLLPHQHVSVNAYWMIQPFRFRQKVPAGDGSMFTSLRWIEFQFGIANLIVAWRMNGIEEFSQPSVHVLCSTLPSFSRIELPCFVQDSEKSLELLGGLSLVDSAIKDSNNVLHFTFPSENVNKTRIVASVVHKNGFLIKIRRKKTQGGAVAIESSSRVIGAVTKSFVFNNLADYEVGL